MATEYARQWICNIPKPCVNMQGVLVMLTGNTHHRTHTEEAHQRNKNYSTSRHSNITIPVDRLPGPEQLSLVSVVVAYVSNKAKD